MKKLLDSIDTTIIDSRIDDLRKYLIQDNKNLKDKVIARKCLWLIKR